MTASTLATPITQDDHSQGPANAAVTLVLYGDYECPYTRLSRRSVHQLRREFSDRLRFVFRHFPLEEIHPHARVAAAAAEAAARQTDFWTMHEYLFEHQKALGDVDLQAYAAKLGLDSERFDASYALEVHAAYPNRFGLVKPVDPNDPGVAYRVPAHRK